MGGGNGDMDINTRAAIRMGMQTATSIITSVRNKYDKNNIIPWTSLEKQIIFSEVEAAKFNSTADQMGISSPELLAMREKRDRSIMPLWILLLI